MLGLVAEDHFFHFPIRNTRASNCLIFKSSGPMPSMGDKNSLQNMIFSLITACTLQGKNIQRFFHHTNKAAIALQRFANFTAFPSRFSDVKTLLAKRHISFKVCQRKRQVIRDIVSGARKR